MENIVEPKTTRGRKKEDITDYERYERQKARVREWKYNKRRDDEPLDGSTIDNLKKT
jgi:hypothetical protein